MWEMIDATLEMLEYIPLMYRVWGFIFSRNYRLKLLVKYKKGPILFTIVDIFLSIVFFCLECYLIYLVVLEIIT